MGLEWFLPKHRFSQTQNASIKLILDPHSPGRYRRFSRASRGFGWLRGLRCFMSIGTFLQILKVRSNLTLDLHNWKQQEWFRKNPTTTHWKNSSPGTHLDAMGGLEWVLPIGSYWPKRNVSKTSILDPQSLGRIKAAMVLGNAIVGKKSGQTSPHHHLNKKTILKESSQNHWNIKQPQTTTKSWRLWQPFLHLCAVEQTILDPNPLHKWKAQN